MQNFGLYLKALLSRRVVRELYLEPSRKYTMKLFRKIAVKKVAFL